MIYGSMREYSLSTRPLPPPPIDTVVVAEEKKIEGGGVIATTNTHLCNNRKGGYHAAHRQYSTDLSVGGISPLIYNKANNNGLDYQGAADSGNYVVRRRRFRPSLSRNGPKLPKSWLNSRRSSANTSTINSAFSSEASLPQGSAR